MKSLNGQMSCVITSPPGIRGIETMVLDEKGCYMHIGQEWVLQAGAEWKGVLTKRTVAGIDKLILVVSSDAVFRGFCAAQLPSDLHSLLHVGIFMNSEYGSTKSY